MVHKIKNSESEANQKKHVETPEELKSTYFIFELLDPTPNSKEYRVKLKSEMIRNIVNSLNLEGEKEREIISQFKDMLDIISVSPHSLTLDDCADVEIIRFAFKEYVHDITKPYVLGDNTDEMPIKLNQRKINSDKYRIVKMREEAHSLTQILSILELSCQTGFGIIIYADFLESVFQ